MAGAPVKPEVASQDLVLRGFQPDVLSKTIQLWVFGVVLIVAGIWRGWGLWYRGLLEHDEGHALLNASTYRHVLVWVLKGGPFHGQSAIDEMRDVLHQEGGTLYSAGKSGYSLLLALSGLITGVSQAQGLLLAWLAGLIVLVAAGRVSYFWFGRRAFPAIITMAGLAFSPLTGYLSREVSGTVWALAAGTAGLALFSQAEFSTNRKHSTFGRIAGGILVGYGFTCHFNLAPYVVAVFFSSAAFLSLLMIRSTNSWHTILGKLFTAGIASVAVLVGFQLSTWVADRRLTSSYPEFQSFVGELHRLFFSDQVPRLQTQNLSEGVLGWGPEAWHYYGIVLLREGPLLLVLILLAPYTIVRGRGEAARALTPAVVLSVIPSLFWIIYPFKIERVLGMCVVPAWILAGGVSEVIRTIAARNFRFLSGKSTVAATTALALIVHVAFVTHFGWIHLWRQKSPLATMVGQTLPYLEQNGGIITAGSFDTGFAPIWKWTIIEELRRRTDNKYKDLIDFSRFSGHTIVFVDPATWRNPNPDFMITQQQIANAHLIATVDSQFPQWRLAAYDLGAR